MVVSVMKMRTVLVLILLVSSSVDCIAATTEQRVAAIEKSIVPTLVIEGEPTPVVTLAKRMEQLNVAGISVAVFDEGRIKWTKAYGYADKERRIRATPETLFEAGSISKAVTALAALHLAEKGTLDLDANVNDRLKSWQLPDNPFTATHKVTLRNILNHTAGTTVFGFPGYARSDKIPSPVDVLEGKGNTEAIRVDKEPGQSMRYSGGGYTIMQVLLTDVTGRSFPDLMHEIVLGPLGMHNSTFEQPLPEKWWARAASGYSRSGVKVTGEWHIYPEMAAAGLWTTAADLAKFALAIERMHRSEGGLLSQQMAHAMLTPGLHDDGLGVFMTPDGKRFGHNGSDVGFQSSLTAFIDDGAGIAVLTNSDNGMRLARDLMLTIARQYGWSGFPQTRKSVVRLSQADSARLLGHYKIDAGGAGEFDLVAQGGRILIRSAEVPESELLAESANKLFFRDDDTPIEVTTQDGATALTIAGGVHAVKVR
jgi:CubicO group peptidase (beta-lactamase class C family)